MFIALQLLFHIRSLGFETGGGGRHNETNSLLGKVFPKSGGSLGKVWRGFSEIGGKVLGSSGNYLENQSHDQFRERCSFRILDRQEYYSTLFSFKGVFSPVKYVGSGVLTDSARASSLPGCCTFVEIQGVALYGAVLRK